MNVKLNALIPELYCADINRTIEFYTKFLGFNILYSRPEDNFVMFEREGAQIMIEKINLDSDRCWITGELEYPLGRGINFQIETKNIDQLYKKIQKLNATIPLPLEEKWYRQESLETGNRQFVVQDPDGYLLRFFQDMGKRPI